MGTKPASISSWMAAMSDGPTGVKCDGSVPIRSPMVPCGTALAASWNPDLVEAVGALLGRTARANGVHVLLAPATNILRSPLGGRNFEYYSEDPFLAAQITCAYVRGVQREHVAATVKQTTGAVGYVEQAYALQNNFTYAAVRNKAGSYVSPTLPATTAAAVGIKVPANLAIKTVNSPNPTAYPIVSQTFVIVYKDMCKAGVSSSAASGVKKFLAYGLGAGQAIEQRLSYAPLPPSLDEQERRDPHAVFE